VPGASDRPLSMDGRDRDDGDRMSVITGGSTIRKRIGK